MDPQFPEPNAGFPPQPGTPGDSPQGLPTPELDAPAEMDGSQAFAIGRAIGNGIAAVKRAPAPMLIAGFLMAVLDGNNSFNSPGGGGGNDDDWQRDSDYGDDIYSDAVDAIGVPVNAAVTDLFGDVFGPIAEWAQLGGAEVIALGAVMLTVLICAGIFIIVVLVARSFIRPGVIRLHSHVLQTAETDNIKIIFSGSDRFLHMLIWEILSAVIIFVAVFVSILPGAILTGIGIATEVEVLPILGALLMVLIMIPVLVYVGLGLAFGAHVVTLEERAPVEALKRSWALASGNRLALFIFNLVMGLFYLAAVLVGILMCCVGALVTVPAGRSVTDFGFTESFLLFTRGERVSDYWKLWEMRASGEL